VDKETPFFPCADYFLSLPPRVDQIIRYTSRPPPETSNNVRLNKVFSSLQVLHCQSPPSNSVSRAYQTFCNFSGMVPSIAKPVWYSKRLFAKLRWRRLPSCSFCAGNGDPSFPFPSTTAFRKVSEATKSFTIYSRVLLTVQSLSATIDKATIEKVKLNKASSFLQFLCWEWRPQPSPP
jgi:hypothetical protein